MTGISKVFSAQIKHLAKQQQHQPTAAQQILLWCHTLKSSSKYWKVSGNGCKKLPDENEYVNSSTEICREPAVFGA